MAEGVFRHLTDFTTAKPHPLISDIDSCGTGAYHSGANPDSRTLAVLAANGLKEYRHKARRVQVPEDFERFDYLIAMDEENFIDLQDMVKRAQKKGLLTGKEIEKIYLYGEFGRKDAREEIDDPYYGGRNGFTTAYEQVVRCGRGLIDHIEQRAAQSEA